MTAKVKVLVVDDSSIMRTLITHMLESDPCIEVVGSAPDPFIAREKLISLRPDVMTLDIEMPRMDGITFLEKVMRHFPTRTVIVSSLSQKGSELALRALQVGAIDVIAKPTINVVENMKTMSAEIVARVKAAATAKFLPPSSSIVKSQVSKPTLNPLIDRTTHQILAIAASTGGTEAIKTVLMGLSGDIPGTVIVQHMPPMFTKTFAKNLNETCSFEVREAQDGDAVRPGVALLAPGNFHMTLERSGAKYLVRLNQDPPQHGVRPAADPMFHSVAKAAGKNAMGVILTGMGKDGALGMKAMRDAGAFTIAQDEDSCVVFGMPKEAIAAGGVQKVLPLHRIADALQTEWRERERMLSLGSRS